MFDTDTLTAAPPENDEVEIVVCELAKHSIGFIHARDADENDAFAFLVVGL